MVTLKLLQNLIFRSVVYVTIADPDIGSLKPAHTLFDKYFYHMLVKFEQNCMVRTTRIFEPFFDRKLLTILTKR